jgi:hypothetical protein
VQVTPRGTLHFWPRYRPRFAAPAGLAAAALAAARARREAAEAAAGAGAGAGEGEGEAGGAVTAGRSDAADLGSAASAPSSSPSAAAAAASATAAAGGSTFTCARLRPYDRSDRALAQRHHSTSQLASARSPAAQPLDPR